MSEDAGKSMKDRLRADLRAAVKGGRTIETKVLRSLIAALDNAEAPPVKTGETACVRHDFRDGSAEVDRLRLDSSLVRQIMLVEVEEHERAADEFDRLGQVDRAAVCRAEVVVAKRYLLE